MSNIEEQVESCIDSLKRCMYSLKALNTKVKESRKTGY